MGEIRQTIELENYVDRYLFEEGKIEEVKIRRIFLDALVDTGSTMLVLPQDAIEKLGLKKIRNVIVTYADERKEERDVAGGIIIQIGDRRMNLDAVIGPPNSEALIGQIVLEGMDLIVDSTKQQLKVRPESPFLPLLKLK